MSDEAERRLASQVAFLNEADKLKSVVRGTTLCDASRYENSAEHSWHLTLYALVLADQAEPDVDIMRVIKMLILHDLVEMEALEKAAADRIFGLLPNDLRDDLRATWEEFEAAESPSAKFAKSLDRFQPPMQNLKSGGGSWVEYNVSQAQIEERVGSKIAIGAPRLWAFAKSRIAAFFEARAIN